MNEEFYKKLKKVLNENQILIEESLAKHTTFQIGGPAQFLLLPESIPQIVAVIKMCKEENMQYYILGNGSNLLVSDKGYTGIVVKLNQAFSEYTIVEMKPKVSTDAENTISSAKVAEDKRYLVQAQAGVLLSKLANAVAEYGLAGFEFAAGIPGTLGGAVTMNAGAYDGEIKKSIVEATVLDQEGNLLILNKEELKLKYRSSIIQEKHYILLEATFGFAQGNKEEIRNKITEFNTRRREKQPLEYPSAGSTFKRPEGYFTGKLIMDSGLKGYQVGKAQISEKHCGFVINKGGATATEVRTLISDVVQIVYNKYGVMLEPEIKLLGDF